METTEQALFSKATRRPERCVDDHESVFHPALTPTNTICVDGVPDDSHHSGSLCSSSLEFGQSVSMGREPQATPSPPQGHRKTVLFSSQAESIDDRHQSKARSDNHHIEAASGTGILLRADLPKRTFRDHDSETDDGYAHQRSAIENFYVAHRAHARGSAPNDSESGEDADDDVQSRVSRDTASLSDRVQQSLHYDPDEDIHAWTQYMRPRTASLEVRASDDGDSDERGQKLHLHDHLSAAPRMPSTLFVVPVVWEEEDPAPVERMYTLPSITEESLKTHEDTPHIPSAVGMLPADEGSQGSSNTGPAGSELQRVPSETQSAPAPLDRRGRRMTKTDDHLRHSSLTEDQRIRARARRPSYVSAKSSPARPATTTVSVKVAESQRVHVVYDRPRGGYVSSSPAEELAQSAHTIQSDMGTYQIVWEEAQSSSSGDSSGTLLERTSADASPTPKSKRHVHRVVAHLPILDRVECKLTAWAHQKQQVSEDALGEPSNSDAERRHHISSSDHSENHGLPRVPPNTAQHSARPSRPQTPSTSSSGNEDEYDQPVEIQFKGASRSHTAPHIRDPSPTPPCDVVLRRHSLPASPTIPRQLSNLALEDMHFEYHRDSVDIAQGHIRREQLESRHKDRPNSLLLAAKDSYGLTKNRICAKAPRAKTCAPSFEWAMSGGLSPIEDSRPTNKSMRSLDKLYEPSIRLSPKTSIAAARQGSEDPSLSEAKDATASAGLYGGREALEERIARLERRVMFLEERLCESSTK